MPYTIEKLAKLTELWLTKGELDSSMLSDDFQFISPFWKSNSKEEFVEKFKNSADYQSASLSKIVKFDPIIRCGSQTGKHFSLILQYHTKNGKNPNR